MKGIVRRAIVIVAVGFGPAAATEPVHIFEPKPRALKQTDTVRLHRECLRSPKIAVTFDSCTELIQSGQLPIRDVAMYRERRAALLAERGEYTLAAADIAAAMQLDPARTGQLEILRARYAADRDRTMTDENMQQIDQLIKETNDRLRAHIARLPQDDRPFFYDDEEVETLEMIEKGEPASESDIELVRQLLGGRMPEELRRFYRHFGGVRYDAEPFEIYLPPPSELFESSKRDKWWTRLNSTGLVDMIQLSWGNDRSELKPGEFLSQAELAKLNADYKCIGWRRDSYGLEAAHYIYFDKDGRFGTLFYDQDRFDNLENALRAMLEKSPADRELGAIVAQAITEMADHFVQLWKAD